MDRIAVFPFSAGCVSESSVAIVESQLKRTQLEPPIPPNCGRRQSSSKSASLGLQKLLKRLKSFSRFFVPDEEEEEEDEVVEMEIGFPTDVQHVAHIGWDDGVSNMGGMKSWVRAPECLSLPSLSLKPFEVAMAAAQPGPLIRD